MREDIHVEREKMNNFNFKWSENWEKEEHRLRLLHQIKAVQDHQVWLGNKIRTIKARIKQLKKERKRDFVTGWKSDDELDVEFNTINNYTTPNPILVWIERFT